MTELHIDPQEVARYLGYGTRGLEAETLQIVQEMTAQIQRVATPNVTHKLFELEGTALVGTNLVLEGQDIRTLLGECQRCILLAATLGQGVDGLIRRLEIQDLSRALIADVCASSMIEGLCDRENRRLEAHWNSQGQFLTDRYSPGYGDLPLTTQTPLCNLLDTRKNLGLSPTSSHILTPRKSITAVIGVSKLPQPKRGTSCEICTLRANCEFRKGGTTCA